MRHWHGRPQIEGLADEGAGLAVHMPEVGTLNDKVAAAVAWRSKVRQLLDTPVPHDEAVTLKVCLPIGQNLPQQPPLL